MTARCGIVVPAVLAIMALLAGPAMAAPPPVGRWITQDGSAIVEIAPCRAFLCGRIVQVLRRNPDMAATDVNNPDPRLRNRRAEDLVILTGFASEGAQWHGHIYDPRSGRTYRAFLETRDRQTLDVRGCALIFCQSQTWRRQRPD